MRALGHSSTPYSVHAALWACMRHPAAQNLMRSAHVRHTLSMLRVMCAPSHSWPHHESLASCVGACMQHAAVLCATHTWSCLFGARLYATHTHAFACLVHACVPHTPAFTCLVHTCVQYVLNMCRIPETATERKLVLKVGQVRTSETAMTRW